MLPRLDVVMSYYEDGKGIRTEYAKQALESIIFNMGTILRTDENGKSYYSDYTGERAFILADDSESEHSRSAEILDAMRYPDGHYRPFSVVHSYHRGIGAALNLALGKVGSVWMYTTDDWVLRQKNNLDLDKAVRLLDTYDLVRLGPLHPNLRCTTKFQQDLGWWLEVDQHSSGFAFATRPFVARLEMFNRIGKFKEGVNSYECERDYAERVNASSVRIAMLLSDGTEWEHVGSYEVGYRDIVHA